MAKKQVNVIDNKGAKTVAKKTSLITNIKRLFIIFSIIWLSFVIYIPLHIKNNYSSSIKKSMVVSLFFDIQRNINEQYERLLKGIKNSINLEEPVNFAINKVKMLEKETNKAKKNIDSVKSKIEYTKKISNKAKKINTFASSFGISTSGIDSTIDSANKEIDKADDSINEADKVVKIVNNKINKIEKELTNVLQTEIDKKIDQTIKEQLDKNSGGLGTTLLTNYGVKHIYPWKPSTWKISTKIYNDLSKSNINIITVLTSTVDKYFNYVSWLIVIITWVIGLYIWNSIRTKVKSIISPFIVCQRCGHTFADKRTATSLIKILKPWTWLS